MCKTEFLLHNLVKVMYNHYFIWAKFSLVAVNTDAHKTRFLCHVFYEVHGLIPTHI